MTREKTIDALKYSLFGKQSGKQYSCGEQIEAIAEAIKLLQQTEDVVPCESCKYSEHCTKVIRKHGIEKAINFCSYGKRMDGEK